MASDTPETRMDASLAEVFYETDRVPFVYWRRFSGARTTVLLTGVASLLAFVTGLSHLSQAAVVMDGPLAPLLPASAEGVVQLSGVLLAFILGVVALGLRRRFRVAWYGALVALPLAAVLPLVTAEPTDALLFVVPLVAVPLVVRNRDRFDQHVEFSPFQMVAITSFVAVQLYGTVGVYVLREQYRGIETWTDAFYYIVVTGTTVGYGDATPLTEGAKLFTTSILIVGTATFGAAFGSLLIPALESRISAAFGNMTASELALLEDHVLVLGYGDLTEPLLDEIAATTVVVVTPDRDTAAALGDRDVRVLTAEPTDEEALLDARIDVARGVVVATEDDADTTLAVLAARQANPDVRIVAAAHNQRHVGKLEHVGADDVISPAVIGGRLLGRSVLGDAEASPFETAVATEGTGVASTGAEAADDGDEAATDGEGGGSGDEPDDDPSSDGSDGDGTAPDDGRDDGAVP